MFQRTASLISSMVHLYTQTDKHVWPYCSTAPGAPFGVWFYKGAGFDSLCLPVSTFTFLVSALLAAIPQAGGAGF
jgi:hypothetical protein